MDPIMRVCPHGMNHFCVPLAELEELGDVQIWRIKATGLWSARLKPTGSEDWIEVGGHRDLAATLLELAKRC